MYVFIVLEGGLIDRVEFFDLEHLALRELAAFVMTMDPEDQDAAVYGRRGLIANAKMYGAM